MEDANVGNDLCVEGAFGVRGPLELTFVFEIVYKRAMIRRGEKGGG